MKPEMFWDILRDNLFRGKMTQGVVDTINAITDTYYAEAAGKWKGEHLAYVLATAMHEAYSAGANPDWLPVREGFAKTNAGAVSAVTRLFEQGRIRTNYALPDPVTGHSYYGRGWVQLTWKFNYERMGLRLGVDLVQHPDLALVRSVSAKILVVGMIEGLFTGRALSGFDIPGKGFDAYGARRIINGLDKAEKIKDNYEIFHLAISSAAA